MGLCTSTGERGAGFLRGVAFAMAAVLVSGVAGCTTKGDFRKLEERVLNAARQAENRPDPFERIAALAAEVESLRAEQRRLAGLIEVAQKTAEDAQADSRKARQAAVARTGPDAAGGAAAVAGAAESPEVPSLEGGTPAVSSGSAEVVAYQDALSAWRGKDHDVCIDRFRKFLQTYPASDYADDAAYWMADCHFKQGDYRVAVLRFNDVVRVYPKGNKAPDALYRQGESLLKLGPSFYDAAKTVFKQVLKDYPDSARAKEATQQLEVIGSS